MLSTRNSSILMMSSSEYLCLESECSFTKYDSYLYDLVCTRGILLVTCCTSRKYEMQVSCNYEIAPRITTTKYASRNYGIASHNQRIESNTYEMRIPFACKRYWLRTMQSHLRIQTRRQITQIQVYTNVNRS